MNAEWSSVSPRTLDRLGTSPQASAPYLTKQELVYRSLRDAIMRCELAPGQRLVIDDLAQDYTRCIRRHEGR